MTRLTITCVNHLTIRLLMPGFILLYISMLEVVRRKVMIKFQENRGKANKWQGIVCPNIFKKLKMNIERSSQCNVFWNGKDGFEVKEKERRRYTINLQNMTCSCRYWQLSGLPCCHALSAICKSGHATNGFIAQGYSIEEYKKTYDHCMEPLEGEERWPTSDHHPKPSPPGYVKMTGRPKGKSRKRKPGEKPKATKMSRVGTIMRCGLCHKTKQSIVAGVVHPKRGARRKMLLSQELTEKEINLMEQNHRLLIQNNRQSHLPLTFLDNGNKSGLCSKRATTTYYTNLFNNQHTP